jgi:serine phosphatase RsbU (regulator of sigma subunit)
MKIQGEPGFISEQFRREEVRIELLINYIRISYILVSVIFEVALYFSSRFETQRFVYMFPLHVMLFIFSCFAFVLLRKNYHPFLLKYFLTTLDFIWLFAMVMITRIYIPDGFNWPTHHMGAVYGLFVLNALSGLRFSYRFSIWSVFLSFVFIGILYGIDRLYYKVTEPLVLGNISVLATCIVFVAIISAIISLRARKISTRHYLKIEELSLAQQIQMSQLPSKPPSIAGVSFKSLYKPMSEIGGDFFDYILYREENLVGIFIGDVSGHGVPAAIITSMIKALIKASGPDKMSSSGLLGFLNRRTIGILENNFFTAFYGIYNTSTRQFAYSRGGHPLPFIIRGNGRIGQLWGKGAFLGIFENTVFDDNVVQLETGDKILFYTDGLIEARNREGKEFEEVFMEKILPGHASEGIVPLVESIYGKLLSYHGSDHFDDDVCIVGMEIL